jgi:hypothetical protein
LDCLIARVPINNVQQIETLEACGFRLKDIRVHLDMQLVDFEPKEFESTVDIRFFSKVDLPALHRISKESFWSTHFH